MERAQYQMTILLLYYNLPDICIPYFIRMLYASIVSYQCLVYTMQISYISLTMQTPVHMRTQTDNGHIVTWHYHRPNTMLQPTTDITSDKSTHPRTFPAVATSSSSHQIEDGVSHRSEGPRGNVTYDVQGSKCRYGTMDILSGRRYQYEHCARKYVSNPDIMIDDTDDKRIMSNRVPRSSWLSPLTAIFRNYSHYVQHFDVLITYPMSYMCNTRDKYVNMYVNRSPGYKPAICMYMYDLYDVNSYHVMNVYLNSQICPRTCNETSIKRCKVQLIH